MLKALVTWAALLVGGGAATAEEVKVDLDDIVDNHILAGFEALSGAADSLGSVAREHCQPGDPALEAAYGAAFDAWVRVSHLRFGPSEAGDRAFALAFWPDTRGATPRALAGLIAAEDPVVERPEDFATVSIAARGFYALEFLLYDPAIMATGEPDYRCALVQAIAGDIAANADAILAGWRDGYADLMRNAGGNDTYRSREEAAQDLYKALATGLEFTADTRLGRPMGSFDRPRPERAEARRSGRSLAHVVLSLEGTRDLALRLAAAYPEAEEELDEAYARTLERTEGLDPALAEVAEPQGRIHVEVLQQAVGDIRAEVGEELAPRLGVAGGFNSLDGD